MALFPLDHTEVRANFRYFSAIQMRWNDLDARRLFNFVDVFIARESARPCPLLPAIRVQLAKFAT